MISHNRAAQFALVTAMAASLYSPTPAVAASGLDQAFGALFGNWKGRGVITPSVGKPAEKITCKVSYKQLSDSVLKTSIRCAAVDFKISARGNISFSNSSKMFSGVLRDTETGWILRLGGGRERARKVRFSLRIDEAKVNGWLNINITSKRAHTWVAQRTTSRGLKQLLRISFRR